MVSRDRDMSRDTTALFLWQIINCSLIGLLLVAVRNFQTFPIAASLVHMNLFLS